jgi:HEAT repeat protein
MRFISLAILLGWTLPASAAAQERGATAANRAAVDEAIRGLEAPDIPTVIEAITVLADAADARATQPLIELLRKGPVDDVTHAAIQALGAISDPASVDVLIDYMRHRRARVRRLAVQSIAEIRNPRVEGKVNEALRAALRDSNDRVRGAAALALGEHGDRGALEVLFLAFDRNVPEAAVAIGKLGGPADAERLASFLGRRQLADVLPGLDEFLRRGDFPEASKIDVIHRLEGIAGPDVKRLLMRLVSSPPESGLPARVREEAERVIRIIPDA